MACSLCPLGALQTLRASWLVLLTAGWLNVSGASWCSAEPLDTKHFEAQLAAGEFAPALAAVQQIADPGERDGRLVRLAQAQAEVGARGAAFATLAGVRNDETRNAAVETTRRAKTAPGAAGGVQADFDSLIELITSTVKPTTWDEVGGPGSVSPYRNGVYVDAHGVLQRVLQPAKAKGLAVERLAALKVGENSDSRHDSPLRKVSLTRLERQAQLRLAAGHDLSDAMRSLAGLQKIKYVLVYPESGDLVLAGPAGDWQADVEGRLVGKRSGRPVLQLDDLVVLLRYLTATQRGTLGCSIDPTQEGLARTKQFVEESNKTPLKPGQRGAWLKKLRSQMGRQTISVEGIDPRTRVARVLVEADYRMKLVGMGLEEGTVDVPSYLQLIKVPAGQAPPPLEVLRWWFALKYDAVQATDDRDAFELRGPGVQVLSENEMLTSLGQQVHTGQSEPLNQEFAQRFTTHFAALADKYPIYADLQNVFDLALVAALVNSEHLAERVNWHMTCFRDSQQYQPALGAAPTSVESVINHRVVNGKHILAGVSGGVHVEPWGLVKSEAIHTDRYGKLEAERQGAAAGEMPLEDWWWD